MLWVYSVALKGPGFTVLGLLHAVCVQRPSPTYISVLQGRVIVCGRREVEEEDNVFEKKNGVVVHCEGATTSPYKYNENAAECRKLNIPIGFNGRERSTAWGSAVVAVKAALEALVGGYLEGSG